MSLWYSFSRSLVAPPPQPV